MKVLFSYERRFLSLIYSGYETVFFVLFLLSLTHFTLCCARCVYQKRGAFFSLSYSISLTLNFKLGYNGDDDDSQQRLHTLTPLTLHSSHKIGHKSFLGGWNGNRFDIKFSSSSLLLFFSVISHFVFVVVINEIRKHYYSHYNTQHTEIE